MLVKAEILAALGDVTIEFVDPSTNDGESGIVAVHLTTLNGVVRCLTSFVLRRLSAGVERRSRKA